MRIYSISSNQNNVNFGKFIDNNGKEDVKAKEIAQEAVKEGRLNKGDFCILESTDIIHIRSEGDTLQAKVINKNLQGVAEEYIEIFNSWVKPKTKENAHEGDKLGRLATGVYGILKIIHKDIMPESKKDNVEVNKELQQELDIFFNRAF